MCRAALLHLAWGGGADEIECEEALRVRGAPVALGDVVPGHLGGLGRLGVGLHGGHAVVALVALLAADAVRDDLALQRVEITRAGTKAQKTQESCTVCNLCR